jgi:limonene-1,2-epoxide hydrolase
MEPTEVVKAFLAALEATDIDRALELVDPAIVYQNVPLPPARGREAFEKQIRYLETFFSGFEARVHHIAAVGDTVLTERTDVLEKGTIRAEFWVDGTFEVEDGRITVWRDRFDWATVIAATVAALARAAVRAVTRKGTM